MIINHGPKGNELILCEMNGKMNLPIFQYTIFFDQMPINDSPDTAV